jgi:hypothetical protein
MLVYLRIKPTPFLILPTVEFKIEGAENAENGRGYAVQAHRR